MLSDCYILNSKKNFVDNSGANFGFQIEGEIRYIESKISYNRANLVNIPKIAGAIELLHHSNPSNSTITVK